MNSDMTGRADSQVNRIEWTTVATLSECTVPWDSASPFLDAWG